MPTEWTLQQAKKIERDFMFGILVSLAPEYVEQLVLDIRQQRINQNAGRVVKPQAIAVSNEWVDQLLAQPFISSKYISKYSLDSLRCSSSLGL